MNSQTLRKIMFAGLFAIPFVPFLASGAFFFPFISTKAFAFRLIVEVIFAAWILLAIANPAYRLKKSAVLYSILAFLAVIGLADFLGAAPLKSFWSNFERMEGYVSLLHFGMLFAVMASVFRETNWKTWWNTTLVASALMAGHALLQVLGAIEPNQSGNRVDGTFGNTIYLAVYMLFHIFLAIIFILREKKGSALRKAYGALIVLELFILYHTATRGAILGLIGGLLIVGILGLFNRSEEYKFFRKASMSALAGIILLVGGFFLVKDTEIVSKSPVLERFASLNLEEIKSQGRYFVWPIAFKGFTDKPILGWGQENFSYVFEKYYTPDMHRLEPWFDRAHNIFLDWMVAGGILGILTYLSLYVTLLTMLWGRAENLSYAEKSVITGLVSAYFFHNFFVFDHLMSYVLFFSLLAYIHFQSLDSESREYPKNRLEKISPAPLAIVSVALIGVVYFVNWQPFITNQNIIGALIAVNRPDPNNSIAAEKFRTAYESSYLGRQEAAEQMALYGLRILADDSLSAQMRNDFFEFSSGALKAQADQYPKNARSQLITGIFLAKTGQSEEGISYLTNAYHLMPGKQTIYVEMANAFIAKGDKERAIEILRELAKISPDHQSEVEGYIESIGSSAQ